MFFYVPVYFICSLIMMSFLLINDAAMKMNEVHDSEDIFAPSICTTALNMIAGE